MGKKLDEIVHVAYFGNRDPDFYFLLHYGKLESVEFNYFDLPWNPVGHVYLS